MHIIPQARAWLWVHMAWSSCLWMSPTVMRPRCGDPCFLIVVFLFSLARCLLFPTVLLFCFLFHMVGYSFLARPLIFFLFSVCCSSIFLIVSASLCCLSFLSRFSLFHCTTVCAMMFQLKLDKHNAAVSHLDWSSDGRHLQSNCIAYELLFWDIDPGLKTARHQTNASLVRDVQWYSRVGPHSSSCFACLLFFLSFFFLFFFLEPLLSFNFRWLHSCFFSFALRFLFCPSLLFFLRCKTCILGWPVQSVFDPSMDGTDVNTVARSHAGALLADGDDFSSVNLFRYPAVAEGNQRKRHASLISLSQNEEETLSHSQQPDTGRATHRKQCSKRTRTLCFPGTVLLFFLSDF